MIKMDVFSLKSFPTPEKIKNVSPAGISFVRYQEKLYRALKFEKYTDILPMDFHPQTLKIFDEKINPTEIPKQLSENEINYICITMKKIDFKIVANFLFDYCYPHEAASLSLGVVPDNVIYFCDKEKYLKYKDKEVKDRTMMLCDENAFYYEQINNYYLPLCEHLEKLLIKSSFDIDKMLLNLIEENIFFKDKEDELLVKYPRLAKQFCQKKNNASLIGKKGNKERNEPHQRAKIMAINYCRDLLKDEKNIHLKSHEIIKIVTRHLITEEKVFNPYQKRHNQKQPYEFKTVKVWINHLIPDERKTMGSPKKEKPYSIYHYQLDF